MKQATICFCIRENQVLLGMKKKDAFGVGKWNGFGGKVDEGETPKQAAVRELKEESRLVADEDSLRKVAHIRFYFGTEPKFECHVYLIHDWRGEPRETNEMIPKWFPLDSLPYADMWAADAAWIPLILAGETFTADIVHTPDGSGLQEFTREPTAFE